MLTAAAVVAFSIPAFAEQAKKPSKTTQQKRSHEECHTLAMQRGFSVSVRDRVQLDKFIADCQAGRVR
jgi:hypothetical protein